MTNILEIGGWIVWLISLFLAVSTILGIRRRRKMGISFNITLPAISFIMLIFLTIFLFIDFSKLHLIWIFFVISGSVGWNFLLKKPKFIYFTLMDITAWLLGEEKNKPLIDNKVMIFKRGIIKKMTTEIINGGIYFMKEFNKLHPLNDNKSNNMFLRVVIPFLVHIHDRILFARFDDKIRIDYIDSIAREIYDELKSEIENFDYEKFIDELNKCQIIFSKYRDITTKSDNLSKNLIWNVTKIIMREINVENDFELHLRLFTLLTIVVASFSVNKIDVINFNEETLHFDKSKYPQKEKLKGEIDIKEGNSEYTGTDNFDNKAGGISLSCPNCNKKLTIYKEFTPGGTTITCYHCSKVFNFSSDFEKNT